jgi:hypothetical protein
MTSKNQFNLPVVFPVSIIVRLERKNKQFVES